MPSHNDEDIMQAPKCSPSYPKCSDDEARVHLYPVQTDVANIPTFPLRALRASPINVNEPNLDRIVSEAIRDMLRFALPDWIMDWLMNGDPCPEASGLPEQSKVSLHLIELHHDRLDWPDLSDKYQFFASLPSRLHFDLLLHRALTLSVDVRCQCATEDEKGVLLTPSLIWTPAYDIIFEYIEHDVLRDAGIAASFRPRWSTYPNQTHSDEWPVIIPDVVFSVQVPGSQPFHSPFTERAHKYHPAHAYDGSHSPLLDVPLLIVEYNKCWGSTPEVGFDPHLDHLHAGMTAALALYDALGIRTPVFGLLVNTVNEVYLFAGVRRDYDGRPRIHRVRPADYKSIFDVTNSIQMLHLYTVLANLQTLSAKVSLHLEGLLDGTEADLSPLQYEWPIRGVPAEGRRVIDRARPALIVDDPLLQFLFVNPAPRIADWLRRGGMRLVAEPASMACLPPHVREWLRLFTTASPVSSTLVQDAVEDCKKGMAPQTQDLIDSFWSTHSAELMNRGAPDAPEDNDKMRFGYIASSLLYSMSACSRALDLLQRPLNWGHSLTNRWLTLHRTLFTEAAGCLEHAKIRYNHQWAVHRRLRLSASTSDDLDTLDLDEIRPEMAFIMPVKSICWRCGMEWKTRCASSGWDDSRIFADLSVSIDLEAGSFDTLDVDMPISVVEYVLTPNNADERKKHVAHLAVSMRSALAIWEMHQLASTAAVLGFLLDRNIVNVFVGWMDKNECVIQELSNPDFTFDISDPSDAYRLFAMLRLQGAHALFDHVNAIIDAHISETVEAVFREDYKSWKEAKEPEILIERIPSSLYNVDNPAEGRMKIESWLSGVAGRR